MMASCSWVAVFVLLQCLLLVPFQAAARTGASNVVALQELLQTWKETPGLLGNWNLDTDADPCGSHWKGVICCHREVIGLDLSKSGIVGSLPAAIGDLLDLKILNLSGNPKLVGAIPKEIGNLKKLTKLSLSDCNLSGLIPRELNCLDRLQSLDLSHNTFEQDSQESADLSNLSSSRKLAQSSRPWLRRALLQAPKSPAPVTPTAVVPTPPTTTKTPSTTSKAKPAYQIYIGVAAAAAVVVGVAICCCCCCYTRRMAKW